MLYTILFSIYIKTLNILSQTINTTAAKRSWQIFLLRALIMYTWETKFSVVLTKKLSFLLQYVHKFFSAKLEMTRVGHQVDHYLSDLSLAISK